MMRAVLAPIIASALLSGCVAAAPVTSVTCTGPPACAPFESECIDAGRLCFSTDSVVSRALVRIDSYPTPAAIYLDRQFIGYSPLRYSMAEDGNSPSRRLTAVPLFAGQTPQERVLQGLPLPTRVSFFMNNPAADASSARPTAAQTAQMRDDEPDAL